LQTEIEALLAKRAVVKSTKSTGFYARVFLVPKKGGKFRPVFNLKPLNAHVIKRQFKMATVRSVANAIRPGDFAVSLDLKDAYLHVPILPSHRRFLKFIFKGQTYHFTVLPFGLSSAPRTFTKLTRVIVIYCRSLGVRLILYLDDSLLLARPRHVACQHRDLLIALLLDLGWLINWEKSDLEPTQDFSFVGLDWSSRTMAVALPQDKLQGLYEGAHRLLHASRPPSCRRIQQFLGKANFASLAIPRARLHTRGLQACLSSAYSTRKDLFKPCPLSPLAREDLTWWLSPPVNGLPLCPPPCLPPRCQQTPPGRAGAPSGAPDRWPGYGLTRTRRLTSTASR